jgi:Gamma-glutamyl cyclotransferase, AIG2-like
MTDGRVEVFFYGLFMDPGVLAGHGIVAPAPRRARAENYGLRIGQRATLVPAQGEHAYGMVYALTPAELDRLYGQPGLEAYRPETIVVSDLAGASIAALCYNLAAAPGADKANVAYACELGNVLLRLGFPRDYADQLLRRDS